MNKRLIIPIIVLLVIVIGVAVAGYYAVVNRNAPKLTDSQRQKAEEQIVILDEKIKSGSESDANYAYYDKAEYLRQLNRTDEALATLEEAYKRNSNWKNTPNYDLLEARIWGQKDTDEGVKRYEALIRANNNNVDMYREYISFLKNYVKDQSKIVVWYETAVNTTQDQDLKAEFDQYRRDKGLQ
jgi:tetratricopeptide (TPR) repeat protein